MHLNIFLWYSICVRTFFSLVLLLSIVSVSPAMAEKPDGWILVQSKGGAFSVSLPEPVFSKVSESGVSKTDQIQIFRGADETDVFEVIAGRAGFLPSLDKCYWEMVDSLQTRGISNVRDAGEIKGNGWRGRKFRSIIASENLYGVVAIDNHLNQVVLLLTTAEEGSNSQLRLFKSLSMNPDKIQRMERNRDLNFLGSILRPSSFVKALGSILLFSGVLLFCVGLILLLTSAFSASPLIGLVVTIFSLPGALVLLGMRHKEFMTPFLVSVAGSLMVIAGALLVR